MKVSFKIQGKKYSAEGSTFGEAVKKLKPMRATGPGIVLVEKGGKTMERVLYPRQMARLFNANPTMREVNIKSIGMLFE